MPSLLPLIVPPNYDNRVISKEPQLVQRQIHLSISYSITGIN